MSIGREDYQDRKEARVERYEERAARAQAESDAASKAAHDILSHIPPGQPILVGHHSERRHRRDLEKSDRNMRRSIEAGEKAAYYAGRAASAAGNTAISSDDPDALDKLEAKLSKLQAAQEWDKGLNAYYRKHGTVKGYVGISDEGAAEIDAQLAEQDAGPYSTGRHLPIPSWRLSNRNAEIRRLRQRIASLQRVDRMEHVEIDFEGGQIVTNEEVNRVQILFDEKPDEATRSKLKSYGFRWSPREKAWQAQRTPRYLERAKYVLGIKDVQPADEGDAAQQKAG